MPTVDATVGGASSNSYVTVATGDTYFDERLQSAAWTGESDADKKSRAVIEATRWVDHHHFEGEKTTEGQALKWPRIMATDDDGNEFDSDAIPVIVQHATFELALYLLGQDDSSADPLAPSGLEGFLNVQIGPLDVTPRHGRRAGTIPDHIRTLLRPVLRSRSRLVRA